MEQSFCTGCPKKNRKFKKHRTLALIYRFEISVADFNDDENNFYSLLKVLKKGSIFPKDQSHMEYCIFNDVLKSFFRN